MKKLFFIAMVLIAAMMSANVESFAQKHFQFKGMEMNGPAKKFLSKMKLQGYDIIYVSSEFNGGAVTGVFANRNATIYVYATPKSNNVCRIIVFFDDKSSWFYLKEDYSFFLST